MTEHGWPDHHDDPDGHDFHRPDDLVPDDPLAADPLAGEPDDGFWDLAEDTGPDEPGAGHPPAGDHPAGDTQIGDTQIGDAGQDSTPETHHPADTVGAHPDALPETGDTGTPFPPALDVGALPEPVDGFPWIDTGSLGPVDPATAAPTDPYTPAELADYAATELTPAADPWAELAGSDDPATSALARFYGPGGAGHDA